MAIQSSRYLSIQELAAFYGVTRPWLHKVRARDRLLEPDVIVGADTLGHGRIGITGWHPLRAANYGLETTWLAPMNSPWDAEEDAKVAAASDASEYIVSLWRQLGVGPSGETVRDLPPLHDRWRRTPDRYRSMTESAKIAGYASCHVLYITISRGGFCPPDIHIGSSAGWSDETLRTYGRHMNNLAA